MKIEVKINETSVFPGQSITGLCTLTVDKPANVQSVWIACVGREVVDVMDAGDWALASNPSTQGWFWALHDDDKHFIFKHVQTVAGSSQKSGSKNQFSLEPGEYRFPFKFVLPVTLLPSFESSDWGDDCGVEYFVKAKVDDGSSVFTTKGKAGLKVVAPVARSVLDAPAQPQQTTFEAKTLIFGKGNLTVAGVTAKRGYTAGETVHFKLTIDGTKCEKDIDETEVKLVNRIKMTRADEENSATWAKVTIKTPVKAGATGEFSGTVEIPAALKDGAPTLVGYAVTSQVFVEAEVDVGGSKKLRMPIIVAGVADSTNFYTADPTVTIRLPEDQFAAEHRYVPPPGHESGCVPIQGAAPADLEPASHKDYPGVPSQ